MKNIIFAIFIFLFLLSPVQAIEPVASQLSNIEISLFGFDYKKESEASRISRIEKTIFGKESSKSPLQSRIDKINSALGLEGQKDSERIMSELQKIEAEELAQDASVQYPTIDGLESEFLNKQYQKESIYKRIERLERTVYGAVQSGELNERVERLKASSSFTTARGRADTKFKDRNYNEDFYMSSNDDTVIQLAGLEMSLFGKTYSQDPLGLRLNRLERKIFQRDFSQDNDFTRIQRLQAASIAKKTSKYYDGNKFNKYTSTGIQLGSLILMILAFIL